MKIRTHLAALAGALVAATALIPAAADSGKIALCHATGSDTNPYVKIVVSTAAFYNSGHVAHAGDIFPAGSHKGQAWEAQGDQSILAAKCVVPTPEPTPSESATPTPAPTVTATPSEPPTPEPTATPEPTTSEPTPAPTPDPTPTVTASPTPQPTETVTVPAPTVTATVTVPGPTATATVTTSPDPQPTATATETLPAPVTTETVTINPAECELGDWAESRMCETERDHPLPVETASSTSTVAAVPAQVPGLPSTGADR